VDVRDEVALRVGVAGPRAVGQVRRQALRRRQPRPFADQQHHHGRVEQFAHVVEHADAAVADDERPAEAPAALGRAALQQRQQPRYRGGHRGDGQAVADDHLHVGPGRAVAGDRRARPLVEPPAAIGAEEEFVLGRDKRLHLEELEPPDQLGAEVARQVQLGANGVAGGGVVAAQVEVCGGAVRRPGPADQQPGRRALAHGGQQVGGWRRGGERHVRHT
jgi:hypothetical protein